PNSSVLPRNFRDLTHADPPVAVGIESMWADVRSTMGRRRVVGRDRANCAPTRRVKMGLMSFIKEAGEKLFGRGEAQAKEAADPNATVRVNQAAADSIVDYIRSMNLDAEGLSIAYDGEKSEVTVSGMAPDQQTKEKILLCCGNVAGVAKVNDDLSVAQPEDEARFYTVVKGD